MALSVFVLVDKSISVQKRRILFIAFGAGLIVSHYSTAYVYLFMMALVFVFSYKRGNNKVLDEAAIVVLSVVTFSWYIFISDSPLLGLTNAVNNMFTFFSQDLFNPSARSAYVYAHLDPSTTSSIIGLVHRLLVYAQNFFIVIGIALLVLRRKKSSFTREYRYISIVSMFILLACLLVPNLAPSLRLERFYQITLLFLAPFSILGGKAVLESIKRLRPKLRPILSASSETLQHESPQLQVSLLSLLLVILLLIAPFLFQSGFIYHVTGSTPFSNNPLDLNRTMASDNLNLKIGLYQVYIPEQDVFGARWRSKNVPETSLVYADAHSRQNVLIAYALLNPERARVLSNATSFENGAYAYLRYLNVHDNTVITERYAINTSEISFLLNCNNKIYSNGASEIYFSP